MTSVAVSPNGEKLAVAIQSSDYSVAGCLAVFLCGADGTLSFDQIYEAGVQPDMVTFTPDSKKILSADEGEPRNGYEAGSIDPKGTVTVIDLTNQNVSHLDFTVFDSEAKRAELVQNGVILKKGTAPSVDLEPEYIAANDKTAYVTLQEANAIAIVDLQTLSIEISVPQDMKITKNIRSILIKKMRHTGRYLIRRFAESVCRTEFLCLSRTAKLIL